MANLDRHWNPRTRAWEYDPAQLERQAATAVRANEIVRGLHARQDGASLIEGMYDVSGPGASRPRRPGRVS